MAELTKLKLIAYSDPDFSKKIGEYDVLFNPENYSTKDSQEFSSSKSPNGSSEPSVKYKGGGQDEFELDLFFDATGVVSDISIEDQINEVRELVFEFNGDIHEPNYVRVYWGTQSLFQGRVKTWNVQNKLIDSKGTPLRAEVKAKLVASISAQKRALEEGKNSADLTHLREVKAGISLTQMCFEIYGDSKYYLKVARHNEINDFRQLKPGDQLSFPPIIN